MPLDNGFGMLHREAHYNGPNSSQENEQTELSLTHDQLLVYSAIWSRVDINSGGMIFIDAPGGTGKTYLINLILAKVRQHNRIALAVASSGIAATLLTGGRTAHSAFSLPLDLTNQDEPTM